MFIQKAKISQTPVATPKQQPRVTDKEQRKAYLREKIRRLDEEIAEMERRKERGEYHVERLWRDSKLLEIGGGTLESHQKNIVKDLLKSPESINN